MAMDRTKVNDAIPFDAYFEFWYGNVHFVAFKYLFVVWNECEFWKFFFEQVEQHDLTFGAARFASFGVVI